jgi:D-erythronate 2-dehydrogenase
VPHTRIDEEKHMNVVITGGAGFLGARLARSLLSKGTLRSAEGREERIAQLTLLDVAPSRAVSDPRVRVLAGSIADPAVVAAAVGEDTDAIFHLAAIVSGQAEADFDLGMQINLDATRLILERARRNGNRPRVVFTSSVAVFGGALPPVVQDDTAATPQSSYGAQKLMCELLVHDYSRKGFVDGRALRMPTICVRPGAPNKAASSFASGIIREPLAGEEAVCPVAPETLMWLMSPGKAIDNLVHGHELEAARLGPSRIVNMPGLSVTVRDMVGALERVAGPAVSRRVRWERDPAIVRIVSSWPGRFATPRAQALGFQADASFEDIVRAHVAETAAAAPQRAQEGASL